MFQSTVSARTFAPVSEAPLYERAGGATFFESLVDRFYDGVANDPVLRPLYPDDLTDAKRWLALFLQQYWGGPGSYSEERGHPRLRMRHMPFVIGEVEADAWMRHMRAAVESAEGLGEPERSELLDYFESAAAFMVNSRP